MHKGNPASPACAFFLFLLLTPVSPQCMTASADECKKSEEFVPGHGLAGRGFDITTLEYAEYNVLDLSGWQKSDGRCTLCENPLLKGKPLQRLPLGITDWRANTECQKKVQHSIYQKTISVAKVMTELVVKNDWKKGLDMEVKPSANAQWAFAGSLSKMTSFSELKTLKDKYTFLLYHASCSYYRFRISKDKLVSENFKNDVKILPEKYEPRSKIDYHYLIAKYGTHFVTEFDLGGRLSDLTAVLVCEMVLFSYSISEISVCLEIELGVSFGFDDMTRSPDFYKCEEKRQDLSFFMLIHDHMMNIEGGKPSSATPLSYANNSMVWRESAKSHPALLSSTLQPLHTLVDEGDPRREGVRQAVSEYVRERARWRNCTLSCPPGVQHGAWEHCTCECPNNNFTNSMCCSQQRGLAKLTVTIKFARGLLGDSITRSDGYVKVFFKDKLMCTSTVWNDNNPVWNTNFDFGIIQVTEDFNKLEVQVWDEDSGWDDDILGRCIPNLIPWDLSDHICYLSHGSLHYKYDLACGPHLGGPSCSDYIPPWPKDIWGEL